MDLILPTKEDAKQAETPKEPETSIDVKDGLMIVQINLSKGRVNAYGTLAYAQEMCSRYYTTIEIQQRKMELERVQAEKAVVDGAISKIGVRLPGR